MRIGRAQCNQVLARILMLGAGAVLMIAVLAPRSGASAATLETLYSFCSQGGCVDGASPLAGLIMDAAGHLYGTTNGGGSHGEGTVFELTPAGRETVLYSFCVQANCADGASPMAGLIRDAAGHLYGTTYGGGAHGQGTVFELAAAGRETVLHSFCSQGGCADGANPMAGLIRDAAGHLYGTTSGGGAHGQGTVFELTAAGRETVLYSFCPQSGCADGNNPDAGLIMDASGKLYGTAAYGGAGDNGGAVFKLTPNAAKTKWTETLLYSFCSQSGCVDGATPLAGLIMDSGRLYGTTYQAGANKNGTVFELTPNAAKTKWRESVLHSFCVRGAPLCADGSSPVAGLIMDASGKLYSTTKVGGAGADDGGGTVFELIPNAANTKWTETVLHSFCAQSGCADGANPVAGLIMDAAGHHLYGTISGGGAHGFGTVFEVTP